MKKILLILMFVASVACCSCNKECHCYGFDGTNHFYSQDELTQKDKTCSEMVVQANMRYYSYCEWDY